MTEKKVECQACHNMVESRTECLCELWLCSVCVLSNPKHSSDYDDFHKEMYRKVTRKL